jgi:hypothetical protein
MHQEVGMDKARMALVEVGEINRKKKTIYIYIYI